MPRDRKKPTHLLVITVPLCLAENEELDYNPIGEAMRAAIGVSRVAADGYVCDDLFVDLKVAPDAP